MTLTKPGYRPRLVDDRVELMLRTFGAVCIEGPKYSGKTWTSLNHANSAAMLGSAEGNFETRRLAEIDPSLVLEGDRPHLVDEWQDVPAIWDAVRDRVDDSTEKGRFILTGSSTPKTKGIHHSGNGRIGDIRMDTMSLFESGDSEGNVSLASLFDGTFRNVACGQPSLRRLVDLTVRGGWPGAMGLEPESALEFNRTYVRNISDRDVKRMDDKERDIHKVGMLIRSLARNESTLASKSKLASDIKEEDGWGPAENTVNDYLGILNRMFLIEDQPAFNPGLRSSYRVGKTAKRHLADPSLAAAAMGANIENLFRDLNTFGLLFEALCERDLRVYSQSLGGTIGHYRDGRGNEIDTAVQLPDGRWGAFEIKLGMNQYQ